MMPNYLIIGDDEYIREREAGKVRDKYLSPDETELNYSVHLTDDADGIMNSLGTMPFLADKRVVLVKSAEGMSEDLAGTITSYLESPSETGVLVLSSAQSFKKTKHYRKISGLVEVISAGKPDAATLKGWVRGFFRNEGVEIAPGAVDLIVELKGDDTPAVRMELDKLICFSGGDRITVEHVEELVGRSVTETVFKLVDAINAGDGAWVFRVLSDLYDRKKRPHEVIGYLAWYIRIMQKVTLLSSEGAGPGDMASELGYSPAYTRRLMGQSRSYPVKRIERWLELLLEADRDIKTGKRDAALALEMLVSELIASK